jgi:uncharacterized DUF497 family protein
MKITFDPDKASNNFRKNGIRFTDAENALYDPMALTREDGDAEEEQSYSHTVAKKFVLFQPDRQP